MGDTDINKRSALHLAACEGQNDVIEYINRHDYCSLEAKDRWKRSAEDDVIWHQHHMKTKDYKQILKTLRGRQANRRQRMMKNFKQEKATELITAAESGNIRDIERLHHSGTDMNLRNDDGQTALYAAVEKEMEQVVVYLLKDCHVSRLGKRPSEVALANEQDETGTIVLQLNAAMSRLLENNMPYKEKSLQMECDSLECRREIGKGNCVYNVFATLPGKYVIKEVLSNITTNKTIETPRKKN
ncbi:ASPG [Mytilus edulis]|uniref:ASPG n=1 Tax=Mytilus edulis TaxID=6550 RepID=A0A8S3VJ95_MYTED|nr:ASPG [Mytilus edulis]